MPVPDVFSLSQASLVDKPFIIVNVAQSFRI